MEISLEFSPLVSNNCYEAHALYNLLENVHSGPLHSSISHLRIEIINGKTYAADNTVYLNWKLITLAVTARGSFNIYINAVMAKMLKVLGWQVRSIPELETLCENADRLCEESLYHIVDLEKYNRYLETFVWENSQKIENSLNELTSDMWFSVMNNNKPSLNLIEKLLVGLLGHSDSRARDLAVIHLNAFYDDTDWQILYPLTSKITTVGAEFCVREVVENVDSNNVIMELHAPGFYRSSKNYIVSFHVPEVRKTSEGIMLKIFLGKFIRCGFYDWRISQIRNGALHPLFSNKNNSVVPIQGRFIVHPEDTRNLQIHEIFIDFQDAKFDVQTGKIVERGSFKSVKTSLKSRFASGINCLYLMGALERDTGSDFITPDASPLAVTCRSSTCSMLGGDPEFTSMMKQAKEVGIKILVDCLARISSKNYHRRYKNRLLFNRDVQGIPVVCYGSDGRALHYEDSVMLNYRQVDVWQLLLDDIIKFANKYKVDGIHIDNAQSWPQIMELDQVEMYRKDTDGQPHYSTQEIFDGHVVKRNEFFAYWASDLRFKYANPIFVKICKELWREFPEFYIVADVWQASGMEERDKCIANSGPIPRLYDLPVKLGALFGKKVHKNGMFDVIERKDVSIMKKWMDDMKRDMPDGALIVQSSTGHSLPYPALLYGRGAWAAVDVLFFMPFIPMSFIGEQDGHAYRSKISSLYDFNDDSRSGLLPGTLSSANLMDMSQNFLTSTIPRTASTTSFSVIPDIKELEIKEEKFQKELGPEYGFDIRKIKLHYQHRRALRNEKEVLRLGEVVQLVMKHDHGWHKQVLAFARCLSNEIAVILINLNEHTVTGYIELSNLTKYLSGEGMCVYSTGDWFDSSADNSFFKEELLADRHYISILPYRSHVMGICPSDVSSRDALNHSIERLKKNVTRDAFIEGNYLIQKLKSQLMNTPRTGLEDVANTIGMIHKYFLEVYSYSAHELVKKISGFDENVIGKLLGICDFLGEAPGPIGNSQLFAKNLVDSNKMGPIVFSCPEIGRFSTIGGLGVMVDELSQGLVSLGEEVWVVSPYYEKNKKGESGYLSNDKANINWKGNITIQFGGETYTVGLHQGLENGVNLLFLHNAALFPTVYADLRPHLVMKQLVGFGKAVLEALCWLRVIPSVMVTNDWFTGLVAAYAKIGAFGQTFEGTTFLHIVHNLDPSYEGRIFNLPADNCFIGIHGLPKVVLVDPYWTKEVVNPSRCALMMSDQWATVSISYRDELLASSPLKELLKAKPQPFAYPNGIPIPLRLKRLEGKGTHLEAKAKLQQQFFGFKDLDDSIALFGFVGRITQQKGVHLILDAAEQLIPRTGMKIQFLVGGPATLTEKYSAECAVRMRSLRSRYPNNFFSDPDNFFYEGPLVNLGCDFGLMPSLFEPGGIVQHEFFVASTPVIAFKTGGLKDTVSEFNYDRLQGSGFVFEKYDIGDFIYAIQRGLNVFGNRKLYEVLRKNAFGATEDVEKVSRAWNKEFYRLKGKIYFEPLVRQETLKDLKGMKWTTADFNDSLPENRNKNPPLKRTASGILIEQVGMAKKLHPKDSKTQVLFYYKTKGIKLASVQLTGSFDKWQIRHPLQYDHAKASWHITLQIPKGRFLYKFVLDGNTWVHSFDHPTETDDAGNINNYIVIE